MRVCQDWLRVVCYGNFPEGVAESKLRSARRLAAEMTEQWWCFYLRQALSALRPRVSKKESIDSDLIVIGDVQLPDNISKVLQKGPKFSHEPAVPAFELLAYNRRMAEKAGQENQERCLLEGVESLQRSTIRPAKRTTRDNLGDIVRYFKDKGLSLTTADKEGGFVIMPSAIYQEKARQAIEKNFVKVKPSEARVKTKAVALCRDMKLTKLANAIQGSKSSTLQVFFSAKTHKVEIPFRTIVSEKGSWQHQASMFLQKCLNRLCLNDPYATKNSMEVARFFEGKVSHGLTFSVDVQDLFYSVSHVELFECVMDCILENSAIGFQNSTGLSVDNFMSLLEFYLKHTFIGFDKGLYLQRKGICIGSCVAPVLCNIFLAYIDRDLLEVFRSDGVLKIFRYVDDFLVVLDKQTSTNSNVHNVVKKFNKYGRGLCFTYELPQEGTLQFLDLKLIFKHQHTCYAYCPRARKKPLPYTSSHSKVVKRAIASMCLESALVRSCSHERQASFRAQIERLKAAAFPQSVLAAVAETLLKKLKGRSRKQCLKDAPSGRERPLVVPYLHRVTHNLKKVANRHGVDMVFSAPKKLSRLCARISSGNERTSLCNKKHANPVVQCDVGVVYATPFSCGRSYVGQTGRCVNDRIREHQLSIKNSEMGNLPAHCAACGCEPLFQETKILGHSRDTCAREVLEAFFINMKGDSCVSEASVSLYGAEVSFLIDKVR